jgi:hypothetical protein
VVSRAFDDVLAAAGGSLPVWPVLISLETQRLPNQRQIASPSESNAAVAFDRQLRVGLNEEEVATFTPVLDRLHANMASPDEQ